MRFWKKGMKTLRFPCKNCDSRFLGCHATCEKYIEADKRNKEILEKKKKEKNLGMIKKPI